MPPPSLCHCRGNDLLQWLTVGDCRPSCNWGTDWSILRTMSCLGFSPSSDRPSDNHSASPHLLLWLLSARHCVLVSCADAFIPRRRLQGFPVIASASQQTARLLQRVSYISRETQFAHRLLGSVAVNTRESGQLDLVFLFSYMDPQRKLHCLPLLYIRLL